MAKKRSPGAPAAADGASESKIVEFTEDLGRLLGTARAKAEDWLGQRKAILDHLTGLRDTANGLIQQLGGGAPSPFSVPRRRGRPPGSGTKKKVAAKSGRKKRTMSAEARARIGAAQRKRWAKQKAAEKS